MDLYGKVDLCFKHMGGIDLMTKKYVLHLRIYTNDCVEMDVYQLTILFIRKNLWTKTSWPCPLPQNDKIKCHKETAIGSNSKNILDSHVLLNLFKIHCVLSFKHHPCSGISFQEFHFAKNRQIANHH